MASLLVQWATTDKLDNHYWTIPLPSRTIRLYLALAIVVWAVLKWA